MQQGMLSFRFITAQKVQYFQLMNTVKYMDTSQYVCMVGLAVSVSQTCMLCYKSSTCQGTSKGMHRGKCGLLCVRVITD